MQALRCTKGQDRLSPRSHHIILASDTVVLHAPRGSDPICVDHRDHGTRAAARGDASGRPQDQDCYDGESFRSFCATGVITEDTDIVLSAAIDAAEFWRQAGEKMVPVVFTVLSLPQDVRS